MKILEEVERCQLYKKKRRTMELLRRRKEVTRRSLKMMVERE